jgi:hypothetical protein
MLFVTVLIVLGAFVGDLFHILQGYGQWYVALEMIVLLTVMIVSPKRGQNLQSRDF